MYSNVNVITGKSFKYKCIYRWQMLFEVQIELQMKYIILRYNADFTIQIYIEHHDIIINYYEYSLTTFAITLRTGQVLQQQDHLRLGGSTAHRYSGRTRRGLSECRQSHG